MTQSVTCTANVKWSISVPPDLDEATQIYLASHGGKKGALSALVQKAVSRYIIFFANQGDEGRTAYFPDYHKTILTRSLRMELRGRRVSLNKWTRTMVKR